MRVIRKTQTFQPAIISTYTVYYFLNVYLQLGVKGYSDKLSVLLEKLVEKMVSFEIDPKRYEVLKEFVSCLGLTLLYILNKKS